MQYDREAAHIARQNYATTQIVPTLEFEVINKLVQQPDASVFDAVEQICQLTLAAMTSTVISSEEDRRKVVGNQVYHTSCCLLEVVQRTAPAQQSKLVEFLYALSEKVVVDPESTMGTGKPRTMMIDTCVVWTGLPTMGYTFYDEFCSFDFRLPETHVENLNAYYARLTAAAATASTNGVHDFREASRPGISVLKMAFESENPLQEQNELALIRAACWWLIYASDRFWANANGKDNHAKDVGCGKRFKEKKWKGFSCDRWSHWEESLVEAQGNYTNKETRKLIEDALREMRRASSETFS